MTRAASGMTDRGEIVPLLLELPATDIALVKFLFESYEGVAVIRTIDRQRALIVVLVSRDFLDVARGILDGLRASVPLREVQPPAPLAAEQLMRYVLDDTSAVVGDGESTAGA